MTIFVVVAHGFAFFCLIFRTEVSATAFLTSEGVLTHCHSQLEEIVNTASLFKRLVCAVASSRHTQVGLKFFVQRRQISECLLQPFTRALHAALIPNDLAKFAMEPIWRTLALYGKVSVVSSTCLCLGLFKRWVIGAGN